MGFLGEYTLHLYCDDPAHQEGSRRRITNNFVGTSEYACIQAARSDGWTVNFAKHSRENIGRGWTRCPICTGQ